MILYPKKEEIPQNYHNLIFDNRGCEIKVGMAAIFSYTSIIYKIRSLKFCIVINKTKKYYALEVGYSVNGYKRFFYRTFENTIFVVIFPEPEITGLDLQEKIQAFVKA